MIPYPLFGEVCPPPAAEASRYDLNGLDRNARHEVLMAAFPKKTIPPAADDGARAEAFSDSRIAIRPDDVAVLIDDPALHRDLQERLVDGQCVPCGPSRLPQASVVIVQAGPGRVEAAVAEVRARARSDAAIIVLAAESSAGVAAAARAAGAFACASAPVLPDHVMALVDAALEVRSARRRVADLSNKLDLETHLASVGRITAGLSHELGSPLAAAMMNMEVAREAFDALLHARGGEVTTATTDAVDARAGIDEAVQSLGRARNLLQTMQELVRQAQPSMTTVDLVAIARDACTTATRTPGLTDVSFEQAFDEPRIEVLTEGTRVAQIVWNLTTNAAQAARRLAAARVRLHVYRVRGGVVISVRDNGPGIAAADIERIFEPFYTTRRTEGGTGLGLALCREYAIQIGADLSVSTAPGRGACFRLRLPGQRRR